NKSGTATITVTVSDGTTSANDSFNVSINPVNDAPTISNIANQTTGQGVPIGPITFTIGDIETAASALLVWGSSANQTLVADSSIVFGGSGSSRTVLIAPAAGQSGNVTITVSVGDGLATATDTFVLTVNPPPPPFTSARINFQPANAPIPVGYLPDGGLVYGARGNGLT